MTIFNADVKGLVVIHIMDQVNSIWKGKSFASKRSYKGVIKPWI